MDMNTCGNVLVSKDMQDFAIVCTYCERKLHEWCDFVQHIKSDHYENDDGPYEDPYVPEDYKEDIVIGLMKHEVANSQTENNGDTDNHVKGDEFVDVDIKDEPLAEVEMSVDYGGGDDDDDDDDEDEDDDDDYDDDDDDDSESSEDEYVVKRKVENADSDTSAKDDRKTPAKFSPTFYRRNPSTFVFIDLYKSMTCLWDPNDKNFNDTTAREKAHQNIINEMKQKCQVDLNEQSLKICLRKLEKQYTTTLESKKNSTRRMPSLVLEYCERCSFLAAAKAFPEAAIEEEHNVKSLVFAKYSPVTVAFIEIYGRYPALYDTNHADYSNSTVRKEIYERMSSILRTEHNASFSEDDVYKGIYYLRQWYYKVKARVEKDMNVESLPEAQQMYLEKCNFLPPKMVKKKLVCSVCNKVLLNETTLQVHMYKQHKIGGWPHKCTECERTFEHRASLIMHEQRSHVGKVHQCEYCERRFAVLVDLQRHTTTHTGEKPFVCELCGKAFRSKTQLGYHSDAIHTKIRAFKCTMCPKDFLKKRDLNDHIKAHLNIRDKICETCGKGFTNCHSLIRHRQIHSEVKKFACKLCDAKFHQFVGLNSHMKRTHGIVRNANAAKN